MPPLVLVLDEARVGPADDDGDQLVRPAAADEVGDVELGGRPRVLRQAHRAAVQEHVEHPLDAAEVQPDPAAAPVARKREAAAVDPGRVLLGHVRRPVRERHLDVRVLRDVVALHRPEARYGHRVPAAREAERARRLLGSADQSELPVAAERSPQRRVPL